MRCPSQYRRSGELEEDHVEQCEAPGGKYAPRPDFLRLRQ